MLICLPTYLFALPGTLLLLLFSKDRSFQHYVLAHKIVGGSIKPTSTPYLATFLTVDFFSLDHLGFVSSMCNYCVSVIIGIMTLILINLCWGYCTFSAQSAITLLSHMSMMNVWMSSSMSVSSWRHCMLPRLKSEKNVGENCFCWERSQIKMDLKRMSWF